jgi:pSer/pThr/pTyr-binding forkhead associated (FHA) protein
MWKLVIEDDEGKRTVVPLSRDDYTIGRKEGNSIRLTERNVSRDHAKLRKKNGAAEARPTYVLDDLQSYNGVYVNGLRVAQAQDLSHGDLIQIGDYRIILQDDAQLEAGTAAEVKAPAGRNASRGAQLMERPNRLVMLAGPTPGAEFPLDEERMSIGRAEDATISINHNSVSRLHCEVHALGDGRFEIVDKGSSNGVRVNAAELRRGIIEAGDIIELGDVKFKFVGAGQIFRPGATESQQLAAIGDRTASTLVGPPRRTSVVPYFIFGAVVAAGSVAAWALTRPKPEVRADTGVTAVAPEDFDRQTLREAKRLCDSNDCTTAHEKLNAEISPSSPLRDSPEFREIENRWADVMFRRADSEADLDRRRSLLYQVEKAQTVDAERRNLAAAKLAALDEEDGTSNPLDLPVVREPTPTPTPNPTPTTPNPRDAALAVADVVRPDGGVRRASTDGGLSGTTASAQHTTRPAAPVAPAPSGDLDKVRQLMLQGPSGQAAARAILEPKVTANRATPDEINALKAICKGQGDRSCVEACKARLGQ